MRLSEHESFRISTPFIGFSLVEQTTPKFSNTFSKSKIFKLINLFCKNAKMLSFSGFSEIDVMFIDRKKNEMSVWEWKSLNCLIPSDEYLMKPNGMSLIGKINKIKKMKNWIFLQNFENLKCWWNAKYVKNHIYFLFRPISILFGCIEIQILL